MDKKTLQLKKIAELAGNLLRESKKRVNIEDKIALIKEQFEAGNVAEEELDLVMETLLKLVEDLKKIDENTDHISVELEKLRKQTGADKE